VPGLNIPTSGWHKMFGLWLGWNLGILCIDAQIIGVNYDQSELYSGTSLRPNLETVKLGGSLTSASPWEIWAGKAPWVPITIQPMHLATANNHIVLLPKTAWLQTIAI
jgi:hypothetical protein